jgi:hypothetical protein
VAFLRSAPTRIAGINAEPREVRAVCKAQFFRHPTCGPGFFDNTPAQMRDMIRTAGFRIVEEDLTTLWNGGIVRFTL